MLSFVVVINGFVLELVSDSAMAFPDRSPCFHGKFLAMVRSNEPREASVCASKLTVSS